MYDDDYSWDAVGHLILLRELCNQGRANQVAREIDTKANRALSKVMMDLNDEHFRVVLSFML